MGVTETGNQLICMVGTDHRLASAEVRSAFTLPAEVRESVLSLARAKLGATGLVLLATCNRTELWASFDGCAAPKPLVDETGAPLPEDPYVQALCDMHMLDAADYARCFAVRADEEAVSHLFNVACGLRSAIVAEDQIVSQVKQSIAYSREIGIADSVLEVLFREAATAAKRVKAGVRFTRAHATAIDQAVSQLVEEGVELAGARCMVIGNGEYGRLAASVMRDHGAEVIVTVRQYTHGAVRVPRGCTGVPYADRYSFVDDCAIIMSSTTSPHYTLTADEFAAAYSGTHPIRLFDLAIPKDIDPAIAQIDGCTVHGLDDYETQIGSENREALAAAQRMLDAGRGEFWDWVSRRDAMAGQKPPSSALFPLFVDISARHAVFIGGGTIALRRIRTLLPFVADITVCAPDFSPEIESFADAGMVTLVRRAYEPDMLEGADFVFACTNDPGLNDEVWAEAKRRGTMLVNVCSDRFKCDFHFPGVAVRDNIVVGVNAGGKDHRRVKQLRARIERLMDEEDI